MEKNFQDINEKNIKKAFNNAMKDGKYDFTPKYWTHTETKNGTRIEYKTIEFCGVSFKCNSFYEIENWTKMLIKVIKDIKVKDKTKKLVYKTTSVGNYPSYYEIMDSLEIIQLDSNFIELNKLLKKRANMELPCTIYDANEKQLTSCIRWYWGFPLKQLQGVRGKLVVKKLYANGEKYSTHNWDNYNYYFYKVGRNGKEELITKLWDRDNYCDLWDFKVA